MTPKRFLYCCLICAVSVWILLTLPFPSDTNAGDLAYIVNGIIELIKEGY